MLQDPRVVRALELALRDAAIRRRFRALRRGDHGGRVQVNEAVARLVEAFYLSEERIRAIVYRKGVRKRNDGIPPEG